MVVTPRELTELFNTRFGNRGELLVYRAPGRVNLIGEHTDYNQGLVLPTALSLACYTVIRGESHGNLRVYSADLEDQREWPVAKIGSAQPGHDWGDYVLGVAQQLVRAGYDIYPSDLLIKSWVPTGAGLSSSAALEVATAIALLASREIDKVELAKLCQRAENQFVGMPCGIMDQYASVFGHQGAAIKIDCRNLESETVRLPADLRIYAVNSMVKHELGSSAYRTRVAECSEAVAAIRKLCSSVTTLRDVSPSYLEQVQDSIPLVPRKRARHVVTENARVVDFAAASTGGDLTEMGRLFIASHRSLQYDYEVSCEELDFLVDTAIKLDGVYGARMTGGGFGGCTVNLVAPDAVNEFRTVLSDAYQQRYAKTPLFYDCAPAQGAGPLAT